jgi:hypothetical protein
VGDTPYNLPLHHTGISSNPSLAPSACPCCDRYLAIQVKQVLPMYLRTWTFSGERADATWDMKCKVVQARHAYLSYALENLCATPNLEDWWFHM